VQGKCHQVAANDDSDLYKFANRARIFGIPILARN